MLDKYFTEFANVADERRLARVALAALEVHQSTGRWPEALDELARYAT